MKVIGALVAIVGLAILFTLGLALWNTSPPQFVGLSMGQTLVGVAAITAAGLAIGLLPRRSTPAGAVAAVRPLVAVQWVLSVIGFVAVVGALATAAYTIYMANAPITGGGP